MIQKKILAGLCVIGHLFAADASLSSIENISSSSMHVVSYQPDDPMSIPVFTSLPATPLDDILYGESQQKPLTVLTFGTFDLFHIGHLNIIKRAKELANGGKLIVGISSDAFNFRKKQKRPFVNQEERSAILKSLRFVDEVFLEEEMELKGEYLKHFNADILVMGDDWAGKFDDFNTLAKVIYLPRTENISTTELIKIIRN